MEGFYFGAVPVVGLSRAAHCATEVKVVVDKILSVMIKYPSSKIENLCHSLDDLHFQLKMVIIAVERKQVHVDLSNLFWSLCGVVGNLGYYAGLVEVDLHQLASQVFALQTDVATLMNERTSINSKILKLERESQVSKSHRELGDWVACFFRLIGADLIMTNLGNERVDYVNRWSKPHHLGILQGLNSYTLSTVLFDFLWDFKKKETRAPTGEPPDT